MIRNQAIATVLLTFMAIAFCGYGIMIMGPGFVLILAVSLVFYAVLTWCIQALME